MKKPCLIVLAAAAAAAGAGAWRLERIASECRDYRRGYVSIGFDDFRASDFDLVLPLFAEHGARATFNAVLDEKTRGDRLQMDRFRAVEAAGCEIGDHTWLHWNCIFQNPLVNGQDPAAPEGGQTPFPSNDHFRRDRGDGRNAFGFPLADPVGAKLRDFFQWENVWTAFDARWGELTDAQCQYIRAYYSLYADTCGTLGMFDGLSNRYLGTKGSSRGSWDPEKGCYTGGIFTGCRTSANHEVWERVVEISRAYMREKHRGDFSFRTWSWPGELAPPLYVRRVGDPHAYLDAGCTRLANDLARFESSRKKGADGRPLCRSWTEVLRAYGYVTTHDAVYPGRSDGSPRTMMGRQMFLNAGWSRKDALAYSTDRTVSYSKIRNEHEESLRAFVEATRHDAAAGLVHGEVIDSFDTPAERRFFEGVFRYGDLAGLSFISKKEAFDLCFARRFVHGNLIRNTAFRNTAAEFYGEGNAPSNPDGYAGRCRAAGGTLATEGETVFRVYGVPPATVLEYGVRVRGRGRIAVKTIRNRDDAGLESCGTLASFEVSSDDFAERTVRLVVPDAAETAYEQRWEGLGDRVMGLAIVYSAGLELRSPRLEAPSLVNRMLRHLPWPET